MPSDISRFLKRLSLTAVVLFGLLLFPAGIASAANDPFGTVCSSGGGGGSVVCSKSTADPIAGPNGVIANVTTILAIVTGIVSVIFIVIGGFKYVSSGGDSSSVASAKSTILYALVGLVVAALARPIVLLVIGRL